MKSPSPQNPPSQSPRRWTSCFAAVAVIATSFASNYASAQQTFYAMSSGNYAQNFADIANWTNNYAAGIGANNWRTATNVATSTGTNFTVFTTGVSGGVQKGTEAIVFLATGTNAGATDLLLNFTGRDAGSLSFDYSKIANTVNDTSPRTSDLKIQYSVDNGVTFADVTGYAIPRITNNSTPESGNLTIALPAALNNQAQSIIRFYFWNNGQTGGSGSRPKWGVDNVAVTSTAGASDTTAPTILTYSPENGALDVPLTTTQLVANFSESVAKGSSGNITLKLASNDSTAMTIDVTNPAVAVAGANATITLPSSLAASTAYYVNIDAGAFKDDANNNFAGISGNSTWAFTTATPDLTAPSWVTLEPTGTNALPTSNLVITYDEAILAGNGTVTIKKSLDNSLVETLTVPGAQVSVSGNTATLNPSTVLDYATGYYVEVSAGAFTDLALNGNLAISGNSAWSFTTRAAPSIVISQYYEGLASNKFIELQNLTASPISLDGYRLVAWGNEDRALWKSGTATSTRVTVLTGTIPANGYFLVKQELAVAPEYAAVNFDQVEAAVDTSMAFNGDDSIVLYNGPGFTRNEVVDAFSVVANNTVDISFYRLNNGPGFDFTTGSSVFDYASVWGTKTIEEVATALPENAWYLSATQPVETLTLDIPATSVFESGSPVTATVNRSGDPSAELLVIIEGSIPGVATTGLNLTIPAGQSSATFDITMVDNPWISGNRQLSLKVSAELHLSASDTLAVQDDPTDLPFPVVINELDSDPPGTDAAEFVELYNNSSEPVSLDGLVLVLFNGNGNISYRTVDLSTYSIPANGFFVIGSESVPNVNLANFTSGSLQNGEDAVALYLADSTAVPNSTPVASVPGVLVDAVVYDTNDPDATVLLAALTPGKPQVDEGAFPESETVSIARVPDGGAPFDSALYVAQAPTPGTTNVPTPPGNTFADWIDGFEVGLLTGFNDDFDNDGLDNALENILGSSPAVANQGLTAVSATAGGLKFQHTLAAEADIADDLTYEYEWSVDLATWNASGVEAGGITVTFGLPVVITPGVDGAPDLVEVTATVAGTGATKVFARLRVDQVGAPQ